MCPYVVIALICMVVKMRRRWRGGPGGGMPCTPHGLSVAGVTSEECVEGGTEGRWRNGVGGAGRSCRRHLGGHSTLALQLRLVLLKRLLPTALEVLAVVVLRHTMLQDRKGGPQVRPA